MPPFKLAELLAAWLLMSATKLFQANQMCRQETKLAVDERRWKLGQSASVNPWEELLFLTAANLTVTVSHRGMAVFLCHRAVSLCSRLKLMKEICGFSGNWRLEWGGPSRSEQYGEITTVRGYCSEGVTKVMNQHYEGATMLGSHPSHGPPWLWCPD